MKALDEHWQACIEQAKQAMAHAYVPYSQFRVGAAVRMDDHTIISGCNIENASYGLTMCAERTALFKAYSEGLTKATGMVIIADTEKPIAPCGACRQVMVELCPETMPVLLMNLQDQMYWTTVSELLPYRFSAEDLHEH